MTFVTLQGAVLVVILALIAQQDFRTLRIPDSLNGVLALAGATVAALSGSQALREAVLASLIGGVMFWLARFAFQRWRGIEGLGLGDVKFITAAGLWLTPLQLPWLVLFASLTGIAHHLLSGADQNQRLPFGPHLALGLFLSWLLKIIGVV